MLNADDLRRCECCEEPTKKVVGFWEGHDSYSGSPRAGAIYSCEDHECPRGNVHAVGTGFALAWTIFHAV